MALSVCLLVANAIGGIAGLLVSVSVFVPVFILVVLIFGVSACAGRLRMSACMHACHACASRSDTRSGAQLVLSRFAGVVLYLLSGLRMPKAAHAQTRRRPACTQTASQRAACFRSTSSQTLSRSLCAPAKAD